MHGEKKKKKEEEEFDHCNYHYVWGKKTQHFYIGINYTAIKMYTLYFRELIYN